MIGNWVIEKLVFSKHNNLTVTRVDAVGVKGLDRTYLHCLFLA